jgi:hypothetical protein
MDAEVTRGRRRVQCRARGRVRADATPYHHAPPVPTVIDHPVVLDRLTAEGLRSLYHNSGAFGFPPSEALHARGWLGPDDPTIRPAALAVTRQVAEPHAATLARLARRAWLEHLGPGDVWVMPMSHWAYELDFGGRAWLPDALRAIDIDPATLEPRNDGAALAFAPAEAGAFEGFVRALLDGLTMSDFALSFPGHGTRCTVHHHRQLWWQTRSDRVAAALDDLVSAR